MARLARELHKLFLKEPVLQGYVFGAIATNWATMTLAHGAR